MAMKHNLLTSAAVWPVSFGFVAGALGLAAAAAYAPCRVRCGPTRPAANASGEALNPVAAKRPANPAAAIRLAASCNPCAAAACSPCNPCAAAACSPCNPCAAAACSPCNPCAAAACSPCNPCAAANPCNPCAAANPCNPCDPCAPGAAAEATGCVVPSLQQASACNPCAASQPAASCNPCNPCAAANPCNPCAAGCNPCNPCAAACNPCNPCAASNPCNPCAAANPCNPCAAACNPCNPCAAKNPCNPCAAANPCNPCAAACNPCNPCAASGEPVTVPDEEMQALYDCLEPLMLEAYGPGAHFAAGQWGAWERFSTRGYISGTHGGRYVQNIANDLASERYGDYEDVSRMPIGSILAKPSFTVSPDGESALGPLFLMEKMTNGWNGETANWRYVMINADGSTFGITGGQNSDGMMFCHECHAAGQDSDYMLFMPEEFRRQ